MNLHFHSPVAPARLDADRTLGAFAVGARPPRASAPWPEQRVRAPLLVPVNGQWLLHEAWTVDETAEAGVTEGIGWRRAGEVLFGVVELEEPSAGASAAAPTPLQTLSEQAYARIFRLLDAQGLPHLWRVWNYLADINGERHGMERYRQFNLGRAQAFEQCARSVEGRVPAACAIGVVEGPLSIAFLAGTTPLVTIENPRQVSAFHYPADYGPRAPIFSRAALAYPPGQEWLFVSGTASIVGHCSLHAGDVAAQTRVALDNVATVLAEANARSRSSGFAPDALMYRVYVRSARDLPVVQSVLADRVGAAPVAYVQADICRSELLVEIEAAGYRSVGA